MNDLDAIELALDGRDREIEQAEENEIKAQKKTAARKATKGKKKAAPRKRAAKKKKDGEMDLVAENEVVKKTTSGSRARKPVAKKPPMVDVEDDNDDDDMELSLFDRLKLSKTISTDSTESSLAGSKRPSPKEAFKKKAPTKRTKAPPKATRKKSSAKAKDIIELSDEEDFLCSDTESENEMEVEVAAPLQRPRRGNRAKSEPATYAVVDDDDSFMVDSDNDSDF